MTECDFSAGYARLKAAMTSGSQNMPFLAQMHEFSMRESGCSGHAFYTDGKTFARGMCETAERFGFDTPSFIWDVYTVEAEALGANLVRFDDMAPAIDNVNPLIKTETGEPPKGLVMLATVQGDVHDIGKNLVGMMLEGAGYEVVNLGVNVPPDQVLEKAYELAPDVDGLSALLTTSMPSMQKTVALFKARKAPFPVIVGGAPVTREYADRIGADGFGENAPGAVETVHRLVGLRTAATVAA